MTARSPMQSDHQKGTVPILFAIYYLFVSLNSILSTHLLDKLDFHNCLLRKLNPHKVCPHTVHGLVPFFFSVVFLELLHRRDGKTLSMLPRKPNAPRNSPFVGSYRLPWQPREPLHPLWDRRHLQSLLGSFPWYSASFLF